VRARQHYNLRVFRLRDRFLPVGGAHSGAGVHCAGDGIHYRISVLEALVWRGMGKTRWEKTRQRCTERQPRGQIFV